jgi:hypothetical protein
MHACVFVQAFLRLVELAYKVSCVPACLGADLLA